MREPCSQFKLDRLVPDSDLTVTAEQVAEANVPVPLGVITLDKVEVHGPR